MPRPLALALLLSASGLTALSACGSPDPDDVSPEAEAVAAETADAVDREMADLELDLDGVGLSSRLPGTLVDAVSTRDGEIELGVTDSVLYTRLSPELQGRIQSEMADETQDESGLGGAIARAVTGAVSQGLAMAVSVPLDEVRDVRYEDGRVVIEMEDGGESPFNGSRNDDQPMLEQFDREAGERLADAFDKARGR